MLAAALDAAANQSHTNSSGYLAVAAALLGGVVSWTLQLFHGWWNRPRLKIEVLSTNKPPNIVTASWTENGTLAEKVLGRFSVRNVGRQAAENCRVFITRIREANSKTTRFEYESAQIPWAGYVFEGQIVPKDLILFADLVNVDKSYSDWGLPAKFRPEVREMLKSFRGTFEFDILATADNAKTSYATVFVEYSGDWHTVRIWKR